MHAGRAELVGQLQLHRIGLGAGKARRATRAGPGPAEGLTELDLQAADRLLRIRCADDQHGGAPDLRRRCEARTEDLGPVRRHRGRWWWWRRRGWWRRSRGGHDDAPGCVGTARRDRVVRHVAAVARDDAVGPGGGRRERRRARGRARQCIRRRQRGRAGARRIVGSVDVEAHRPGRGRPGRRLQRRRVGEARTERDGLRRGLRRDSRRRRDRRHDVVEASADVAPVEALGERHLDRLQTGGVPAGVHCGQPQHGGGEVDRAAAARNEVDRGTRRERVLALHRVGLRDREDLVGTRGAGPAEAASGRLQDRTVKRQRRTVGVDRLLPAARYEGDGRQRVRQPIRLGVRVADRQRRRDGLADDKRAGDDGVDDERDVGGRGRCASDHRHAERQGTDCGAQRPAPRAPCTHVESLPLVARSSARRTPGAGQPSPRVHYARSITPVLSPAACRVSRSASARRRRGGPRPSRGRRASKR